MSSVHMFSDHFRSYYYTQFDIFVHWITITQTYPVYYQQTSVLKR